MKQLVWNRVSLVILFVIAVLIGAASLRPETGSQLQVRGSTFAVLLADTAAETEQGLSGRQDLPSDQAMLFMFNKPDIRCFWMKDMKFNLDMVWLDHNKQVNAIEQNVSPGTYPDSFCHVNARYVLEFNAGTVRQLGLKIGDKFRF